MKRLLWIPGLFGALLLSIVPVLAEDGFYVVPTRVAPGTCITSLPCTITTPGYYYLTRNLTYTGGNGITVDADNVTLDLMGFCLTGPAIPNEFFGILIKESRNNVEVRNGTVSGWGVGIVQDPPNEGPGTAQRVICVRAVGNSTGIFLGSSGTGHLIRGCTVVPGNFGSGDGLIMRGTGTIQGCTVINCNGGILSESGTISDNVVLNSPLGWGIKVGGNATVSHNSVINCTTGIDNRGGSLIGNAVFATSGQTALKFNGTPGVADQNSFDLGSGATYYTGTWAGIWGVNGGAPPTP